MFLQEAIVISPKLVLKVMECRYVVVRKVVISASAVEE